MNESASMVRAWQECPHCGSPRVFVSPEPRYLDCGTVHVAQCQACGAKNHAALGSTHLWATYDEARAYWELKQLKPYKHPEAFMAAVRLAELYFQETQQGTLNRPGVVRALASKRALYEKYRKAFRWTRLLPAK